MPRHAARPVVRRRVRSMLGWFILLAGAGLLLLPRASPDLGQATDSSQPAIHVAEAAKAPGPVIVKASAAAVHKRLAALVWWHNRKHGKEAAKASPSLVAPTLPAPQPTEAAQPPVAATLVAASDVSVHIDPHTVSDRLFTLSQGEKVEETGSSSNWVEIRTASGQTGWVYSKFLSAAQNN